MKIAIVTNRDLLAFFLGKFYGSENAGQDHSGVCDRLVKETDIDHHEFAQRLREKIESDLRDERFRNRIRSVVEGEKSNLDVTALVQEVLGELDGD